MARTGYCGKKVVNRIPSWGVCSQAGEGRSRGTMNISTSCPLVAVKIKETGMKNDKLKSTTVRFTESDLHIIACLQDKLGLGMIQVIRLARWGIINTRKPTAAVSIQDGVILRCKVNPPTADQIVATITTH
jgi:hypothetical protein